MRKYLLGLIQLGFSDFAVERIEKTNITPEIINKQGVYEEMLLHYAVSKGALRLVRKLLDCGADINLLSTDAENFTPLMLAAKAGNNDMVNLLRKYNPTIFLVNSKGMRAADYVPNNKEELKKLLSMTHHLITDDLPYEAEEELEDTIAISGSTSE